MAEQLLITDSTSGDQASYQQLPDTYAEEQQRRQDIASLVSGAKQANAANGNGVMSGNDQGNIVTQPVGSAGNLTSEYPTPNPVVSAPQDITGFKTPAVRVDNVGEIENPPVIPDSEEPKAETASLEYTKEKVVKENDSDEDWSGDNLKAKLNGEIVDVTSGLNANAVDQSEAHLREQTTEHGFKGFLKKVWHGNIARDYIRQREIITSRAEMVEQQNMFLFKGGDHQDHAQEMGAIVERFTNQEFDLLHSGETNVVAAERVGGTRLENSLRELVHSYATGDIDDDSLAEGRVRILEDFGQDQHGANRQKGLMFADNILELARNARSAVEHNVALSDIDAALNLRLGDARVGVRTAESRELVDRTLDKLHSTKLGSLVNETTLGAATAIAIGVSKYSLRRLSSTLLVTGGLGFLTGGVAGLREAKRIGQERHSHAREMAEGGEIDVNNSRRREQLEATRFETISCDRLVSELQNSFTLFADSKDVASVSGFAQALAEASTRVSLSDEENEDLISYGDATSIEQQRNNLDIEIARARRALGEFIDNSDVATLTELRLEGDTVEEVLKSRIELVEDGIYEDMSDKDRAFRQLRRHSALRAAAIGAAVGVVFGSAGQEIHAALDHSLQGVFEHTAPGQNRQTELAAIFQSHNSNKTEFPNADFAHSGFKVGNNAFDVPAGYHIDHNAATGALELLGPDKKVVLGNLGLEHNGNINPASLHLLEEKGFHLRTTTEDYIGTHVVTEAHQLGVASFMAEHPKEFTSVHRELWYADNSPVSIKNELALDYGGVNGTGINAHGDYVLNVSHMTPNGSYEHGLSANYQQLIAEHHLAIGISVTQGTESHVVMVPVDAQDNAVFNPNNPIFASVFKTENGQAHFVGGYAEAMQLMGTNPDGSEKVRMLATVVGDNQVKTVNEVVHHLVAERGHHIVHHIGLAAEKNNFEPVEVTPVIPLYARTGLEKLSPGQRLANPAFAESYYGGASLADLQNWVKINDRLKQRYSEVDPDGSVKWHETDGSLVERSVPREREAILKYLNEQKAENPNHYEMVTKIASALPPMDDSTRVAVNIPAWMEEKNLTRLLDQYTDQTDANGQPLSPELYEINLLINRKTGSQADNSVPAVESFISDFEVKHGVKPKVNYFDVELDPPLNNVGYARKLITDATVLRSVQRTGQQQPLYIESEDADLLNVDTHTVNNLIQTLDKSPQLEAVRGIQDRAPEYLKDNDYLFIKRRAWDFFELMARNKKFRDPTQPSWNYTWNRTVTGGWNSGYTAEAYADIEGYDNLEMGEDMMIGEKISMIRGNGTHPNLEVVGRVYSRTDASPRRFIQEITSGKGAYSEEFSNEETNQTIRDKSIEQLMETISHYARITPENEGAFSGAIENYAQAVRTVTPSQADANQLMRRLLFWLGFEKSDYQIAKNGNVKINSWDSISRHLEQYRVKHA